ncbi:MAG TPA: glycoside hydrolase family 15 protein, partial [Anaerolineae bacterium]
VDEMKGIPMLFAERGDTALALACSAPWLKRSVGFAGTSDGWQDVTQHLGMQWAYERAENGNVALTGEIDLAACDGEFTLALGFAEHALEAGHQARASLLDGSATAREHYLQEWKDWQATLLSLGDEKSDKLDEYRVSTMVLRTHEDKVFRGGMIASLSIPWGFSKGDDDLGGYHLVWTRDLVETVGGLMSSGAHGDAARVLRYLQVTQDLDGHWVQNMWLDGTPYWSGIQLDESAFPILLTEMAWREGMLDEALLDSFWPMVRQAAAYVVANGPVTQQDRWEETAGFSPFTLAVEVAGLLAAAALADRAGEADAARYLRETADNWNANIERWTYARGTDLCRKYGVDGYYVRMAPPEVGADGDLAQARLLIKNRPGDHSWYPATSIISPDALALVRFGLRAPDDPRIVNTIKVVDAMLKLDTPVGPTWHRYNEDGYGEQADGSAYDGTGVGRCWPLLVGERAHYELAAGHFEEAERLMRAMEAFANEGGMIPEQTWDAADVPAAELFLGRPAGSAMPLVWAHAEYIKLRRSLREHRVMDMPPAPVERYRQAKQTSPFTSWRFGLQTASLPAGQTLRVEPQAPALIHWSADAWRTTQDTPTRDTGLGVHVADLSTSALTPGTTVEFTFEWTAENRWEGRNFAVQVVGE